MPKVSQAYIAQKKEKILDAAVQVFSSKPLYEMTMLDVIHQAGLSRGGIYKYYDNIDEVLVAMINRMTAENRFIDQIEETLANSSSSKAAIEKLLSLLGRYIQTHVNSLGKVQFELTVLVSNHPEKVESILSKLTEQESGQYLMATLFEQIQSGIVSKTFQPRYPVEDISNFIILQIDGFMHSAVMAHCYGAIETAPDEDKTMSMLTEMIFYMLGV